MTNSTHCTLLAKQACTTLSHVVQKITPPSANNFLKLFFALFAILALGVGNAWAETVTMTAGTNGSACKVNSIDGIKVGTSKLGGDMTITVPAGATSLQLYAAAWKGVSGLSINLTPTTNVNPISISLTADDGITSNSPFTLSGNAESFKHEIALSNITSATTLTLASSTTKRFVVWGATCTIAGGEDPGTGGETPEPEPDPTPDPGTGSTSGWVETAIGNISASDIVVVTMSKDGTTWAMSNDKGTSAAPAAVSVTVNGDKLAAEPADNLKWNISYSSNSLTIYPNGDNAKWLYCTATNNGTRVGTNSNKTFTIDGTYLKHTGTGRYVGVYNSQDWRCYTSSTTNINDQTLKFYKYVAPSSGGDEGGSTQPALTKIQIDGELTNKTYEEGDELDLTGLTVLANYESGDPKDVTNEVEWSYTPNPLTKGTTSVEVTATYEDKTATQTINGLTVNEHIITPGEYCITPNNDFWGTNYTGTDAAAATTLSGKQNDITILHAKNTSNSLYVNDTQTRAYAGHTMKISVPSGYVITRIAFTKGTSWEGNLSADCGTINNTNWTGTNQNVTITFNDGKCFITKICVTYIKDVKYALTITEPTDGTGTLVVKDGENVLTSGAEIYEGTKLTIIATPETGYEDGVVVVKNASDEDITATVYADGVLTMPAYAVTISATFEKQPCTLLATPAVSATTTYNSATLTWEAVTNAAKYSVKIGDKEAVETTATSYEVTGLNAETEYTYQVKAIAADGQTDYCDSEIAEGTFTTTAAPAAKLTLKDIVGTKTLTGSLNGTITLPTEAAECSKTFVGWSAVEILEPGEKPATNFYAPGAEYTLASETQTLYAVYADGESGGSFTITKTMSEIVSDNDYTVSANNTATCYTSLALDENITLSTTGQANCGSFWNDPRQWRLYQNKSGNAIVTASNGFSLTSVKFTFTVTEGGTLLNDGIDLESGKAVTASGTSVTYLVGDTEADQDKGQVRITAIEVSYSKEGEYSNYSTTCVAALAAPTFSVAEGTYTEVKSIELSATEGNIYYTLDGTEPTKSSTQYTAAIALNECGTTTIKAIAINDESQSPVASATYTINLPITNTAATAYTPAEAITIIDGACDKSEEVYVKGVVVSTSEFNATYGNYDVIVKAVDDNSATPTTFTFYRMYKAASNTKFTASDDVIGVGDIITAKGVLKKYNSTYELAEGCYMVERDAYTEPKTDISNTLETSYTVDKAFELISDVKSDLDKEVYVKGLVAVASTELYNEKYLTYSISDNGQTTGNVLKVYDGLDIGGVAFTSKDAVKVGDYVVVKGKLLNYNGTYEINKDNQLVQHVKAATITIADITMEVGETKTIEATITPDAAQSTVQYAITAGSEFITLNGTTITAVAAGTATITATIAEVADKYYGTTKTFNVTVKPQNIAVLPFTFDGGRDGIETTLGMSQDGLDSDYGSSPKLKFNTTGDYVLIHFDSEPGILSYDIKGNSYSGGTFTVQESENGETYTDIVAYTELSDKATKTHTLTATSRYVKFIYTEKVDGNVGLGNINITKLDDTSETPDQDQDPIPGYNPVANPTTLSGIFSVDADKKVQFSTGNLQYEVGTNTWSFASEQYEVIGGEAYTESNNTNYGMNVPNYTGKLDLFAWSCDGKYGVNPSNTDSDYQGTFVDWGTLAGEGWFTLTKEEMNYILNRTKNGKKLWALATIDDLPGLILLPDNWNTNITLTYGYIPDQFVYQENLFTAAEWKVLEVAGAVFLPAAGSRTGGYGNKDNAGFKESYDANEDYFHVDNVGIYGYYWLNTQDPRPNFQHCASYLILPGWDEGPTVDEEGVDDLSTHPQVWSREKRRGNSVRLVKTVKEEPTTTVSGRWELVTDASTLAVGDKVVIVAKDYNYALSTTQKEYNRGQASIKKEGNTISFSSDVQILTLKKGYLDNTFALYTGDGYLYAASNTNNQLKTIATIIPKSSWSITIKNNITTITAQENSHNILQYNLSSKLFSCYESASLDAICLYRKTNVKVESNQTTTNDIPNYSDVTVGSTGQLNVEKPLIVENLYIQTTMGAATSAQISNATNTNLLINGDVFIDITLGKNGDPNQWHAFTVPFPVDAMSGVYDLNDNQLKNEVNYAIMDYHGDLRANGQYGWKKYRGILVPGTFYLMTVDGARPTYRFKKVEDAAIVAPATKAITAYTGTGDATKDKGWNGVGNPTLMHGKVAAAALILDPISYTYQVIEASSAHFTVGTPFFIQTATDGTMTITAEPSASLAPARRAAAAVENIKVMLGNSDYTDYLYVSASEDAINEYEIGKDLGKMAMTNTPRVVQISALAYDTRLCMIDAPMANNEALVALNLYAPANGEYILSVQAQDNEKVYLLHEGTFVWDLSMSEYPITLNKGDNTGYSILVHRADAPTSVETIDGTNNQTEKLIHNGNLYILHNGKVFDAVGTMLK